MANTTINEYGRFFQAKRELERDLLGLSGELIDLSHIETRDFFLIYMALVKQLAFSFQLNVLAELNNGNPFFRV